MMDLMSGRSNNSVGIGEFLVTALIVFVFLGALFYKVHLEKMEFKQQESEFVRMQNALDLRDNLYPGDRDREIVARTRIDH